MSLYQRILIQLLKESKKSEKNLDNIDPDNIGNDLVVELIKSKDNIASGIKYTVEKIKTSDGKFVFELTRPGFKKRVTLEELQNNYKRA